MVARTSPESTQYKPPASNSHSSRKCTSPKGAITITLNKCLGALILICVLPLFILAAYLAFMHIHVLQGQRDLHASDQARNIAYSLDRHIESQIAALRMLSALPFVDDSSTLEEFYNEARAFHENFGGDVILADPSKQMVFNTRVPFGVPLPKLPEQRGYPAADTALATGKPAITDVFIGPVVKEPLVAMVVPLIRHDRIKFLLICTIDTRQFQQNLEMRALPSQWSVTVLDRVGGLIAHRGPSGNQTAQPGTVPPGRFTATSAVSQWSVIIDVPDELYHEPINSAAIALIAVILSITLISILGARFAGRRLDRSVKAILEPTSAHDIRPAIAEIEAVRLTLQNSASARDSAEKTLRGQREWLRVTLNSIGDAVLTTDVEGKVTFLNPVAAALTGRKPDEAMGRPVQDIFRIINETTREPAEDIVGRVLREGSIIALANHTALVTEDGQEIPIEDSAAPIKDSDDNVLGVVLVFHDVSEKRRNLQVLRESEERFRIIFEQAGSGVAQVESRTGRFVRVNTKLCEIVGYSREELLSLRFQDITHPDHVQADTARVEQILAGEIAPYSIEKRYIHKNGSTVWVTVSVSPMRGETLEPNFHIAVVQDITERKRIEQALAQSEEQFRSVVEGSPDAIFVQAQGRFAYANAATLRLFGATSADHLLGMPVMERFHPDYHEEVRQRIRGLMEEKKAAARMEQKYLKLDGTSVDVDVSAVPTKYGNQDGALVFVRDITERKRAEWTLRESERRYRMVADYNYDWEYWIAPDRRLVYVSPSCERITGYTAQEFISNPALMESIAHPEDREWTANHLSESGNPDYEVCQKDLRIITRDGEERWINHFCRQVVTEDGTYLGRRASNRDITERKRAERALAESELRFRSAVDQAADAFFLIDEHQHFVDVNQAACTSLGYTRQELLGMSLCEVDPSAEPDKHRETIWDKLDSGQKIRFQTTHRQKNGSLFPVEVSTSQLELGGQKLIQGLARDISERISTEEKLLESSERINALFGATTDSVILMDSDCIILAINETGAIRRDRRPQDLIGRSLCETLPAACADVRMAKIQEIVRTGQPMVLEEERDGLRYSISMFPVFDKEGEVSQVASFSRDITAFKRGEEERDRLQAQLNQAQKLEALGTLAGGVAHDFNNILGIIIGYTELAKMEVDEEGSITKSLQEVLDASTRAKELVKQILAFSRRAEHQRLSLQLGSIVKEAMKILRPSLPSTIEIKTEVLSKSAVLADPTQMHQVLMNLCANAAHSMREKGGVLEVSLCDRVLGDEQVRTLDGLQAGPYVELRVRDTGHGIDPDIIDSIFDPFFTTKGLGEGTGLGLSVVHGIIKSYGGTINVESTVGRGTVFTILIPALKAATLPEEEQIAAPLPRGNEHILVVDDEPMLAQMLVRMLTRLGYDVISRTSGIEALEMFRNQPNEKSFDLIITDMTMPHLTGSDLAQKLSKLQPEVKIILMTGFSEKIDAEKAKNLRIQGFLMKPVVSMDLAETVRKVLDQKTEN